MFSRFTSYLGAKYLIRWSDTWEPAEYIEKDCAEELERFLEKRKSEKRTSKTATRNRSPDQKSSKKKEKEERKSDPVELSGDEAKSSSDGKEYELEEIKKYRVRR